MGRLITKVTSQDPSQWAELAQLSDFQAARFAELLGLSRRQVERYIKRHFALTPQQWLRNHRMARAGELIRIMHSVKEVAYALKYTQVSTFCRQFKEHYGMTCTEYAAQISAMSTPPRVVPNPALASFPLRPSRTCPPAHVCAIAG